MRLKFYHFILLSFSLSFISACDKDLENSRQAPAAETISVIEPYIRAMPPGQKVTAMFMTINNPSLNTYSLIRVESDVSEHVELHQHKNVNGMMQMGQVENIEIAAQGNTKLAPGGYHVMLIGLKNDIAVGQNVDMVLNFKDGSKKNIKVPVQKIAVD
jgi:hypothetical protein